MRNPKTGQDEVSFGPTKAFFVEMLTKDIQLEDAVLDLLDNCVDGALRCSKNAQQTERPYEGYFAELAFAQGEFSISDNCGGISNDVRDFAFRLGRPPTDRTDDNLPTVGIYGIGMKRAIFKMGYECLVESYTAEGGFKVQISREWMANEDSWLIPVEECGPTRPPGTKITISDLRPEVRAAFAGQNSFTDKFRSRISQYYSVLIEKGFQVRINGAPIPAMPLSLRSGDLGEAKGISPYIYENNHDGIQTEIMVGFFAPFEGDADEDPTAGRAEEAGWTVVCNDRVVVYKDKTNLTGWGDGAPNYHPQFRQISGLVTFTSSDPSKLPITTTKQGVNIQNPLFMEVRKRMRDGLKLFTSYTNSLKKVDSNEREQLFRATSPVEVRELRTRAGKITSWTKERIGEGRYFKPDLPHVTESTSRKVVFSRPQDQISKVGKYLLSEDEAFPSDVGAAAFDHVLELSKVKR